MSKRLATLEKDKAYDATKLYSVAEAASVVKKTATAKFDETIEIHVKLGVDPKQSDQNVRGTVVLPHGTGKSKRVVVVAKGEKVKEATAAGADLAGDADVIAIPGIDFFFFGLLQPQKYALGQLHARTLLGKRSESYTLGSLRLDSRMDFHPERPRKHRLRDRVDRQGDEPDDQTRQQELHAAALLDFSVTLFEGLRLGLSSGVR